MADGQIIVYGMNVLAEPATSTNSIGGTENQGTMTILTGVSVFEFDDIVVLDIEDLSPGGEVTGSSRIVGITVYEDTDAYNAGSVKYLYTPQNPGQFANVQSDVSGLGDNYLRFNANVLIPDPLGSAPVFTQLIVAAGVDLEVDILGGPVTLNRYTDNDYDQDGFIATGTVEDANGLFNTQNNIDPTGGPVCFARGAGIETNNGRKPVETLRAGDLVRTRDHGLRPIRWIGSHVSAASGVGAPVVFEPGAIGNDRRLVLSQQHLVLVEDWRLDLICGEAQALTTALSMVDNDRVHKEEGGEIEYFHMLFDDHELVSAEGAWVESLNVGPNAYARLSCAARRELNALLPGRPGSTDKCFACARPVMKRFEFEAYQSFRAGDPAHHAL